MCQVLGKADPFPSVKMPKKRALRKDKGVSRGVQEEALLRKDIIRHLRKNACHVWRIEPSFKGKFGCGDLWVFSMKNKKGGWIEVKSPTGLLTGQQPFFQQMCNETNINYWVVRSVEDCGVVLG